MPLPVPNELTTTKTAANVTVKDDGDRSLNVNIPTQYCGETDLLEIAAFLLLHAAQLRRKNA